MPKILPEFSDDESQNISQEFQRVGENVYLDHAGTTLYADSQIDAVTQTFKSNLFCNPHTCKITADLVDQVRYKILNYFNTDATEYAVVFTANATAALKLVAETFAFNDTTDEKKGKCGGFYYCQENHTSVLGMRELVKTDHQYMLTKDDICANTHKKTECLNGVTLKAIPTVAGCNSLVAFSAQCNFSGYKMPLDVIEAIQRNGLIKRGKRISDNATDHDNAVNDEQEFYVCLDTASFVSTNYLNLQKYKPDYCCISFYKMFGYPTGVGALLVSRRGQCLLKKKYYGGGTVEIAMTRQNFHQKRMGFHQRFEDGTLPFLAIAALLEGYRTIERLIPATQEKRSSERISTHVYRLAQYCHDALTELRHANGAPVIKFYNHNGYSNNQNQQGGIVAFNILHDVGTYVGFAEVACMAALYDIQLRTGCFCNPGACQTHLQLSDREIQAQYAAGHICSDYNDLIDGRPTGAVRVSFGYMTTYDDIKRLINMIRDCYVTSKPVERLLRMEKSVERLPMVLQHVPARLQTKLQQICIYPIKSCGAFRITDHWDITSQGLKYDRKWMVVDANGQAVTQKQHVRLCLIKPHISLQEAILELNFPKMSSIRLPLELDDGGDNLSAEQRSRITTTSLCQSKVCDDLVEGIDCGEDVAAWLSDCLETPGLRLIQQYSARRTLSGNSKELSLSNQAQFLLVNVASICWLANKVETQTESINNTIDRFRANLIIETAAPLEENDFEELQLNGVRFKVDGFCTRCQMICIDQESGQKTAEPLRTIAREFGGKIRFGIYLSLADPNEVAEMHSAKIECGQILNVKRHNINA